MTIIFSCLNVVTFINRNVPTFHARVLIVMMLFISSMLPMWRTSCHYPLTTLLLLSYIPLPSSYHLITTVLPPS